MSENFHSLMQRCYRVLTAPHVNVQVSVSCQTSRHPKSCIFGTRHLGFFVEGGFPLPLKYIGRKVTYIPLQFRGRVLYPTVWSLLLRVSRVG